MAVMIQVDRLRVEYAGEGAEHGGNGARKGRAALRDLSFTIQTGERVALLGANGAGKSTLLLALLGVVPHSGGTIEIAGLTLEKKTIARVRSRVGLVFQNPDDQLFMTTVWEDVLFGPSNALLNGKTPDGKADVHTADTITIIEEKAQRLLETLGIAHLKDRMSHRLSGGEKRLCALAAVLVMEPDVLLLDEPTAFLDPRGRRVLTMILAGLPQTMLIATHDTAFARELAARALLLSEGAICADGPAETILDDTALLETSGF
jgi:cobalt/nickel transport system ATP-binding protein